MRPAYLLIALIVSGCTAPPMADAFHQLDLTVEADPARVNERFAAHVDGARHSVHAALPTEADGVVAQALVDAWGRGLDVQVVTDVDEAATPGVAALLAAGVPVQLADGELTYFEFNLGADILFPSNQTVMSHAFVVADAERVIAATRAGSATAGESVVLELRGEDLVEDLLSEHRQVFGGADATSTTAFDNLAKSIADARWRYPTQTDLDLEVWFGPQERLIKRMIDAIYAARGDVRLLTNGLTDAGIARAMQDKARLGFPVEAVVGPAYDRSLSRPAGVFQEETPDVVKKRFTGADAVPTILLVDVGNGLDGRRYDTRAFVLSHDVYGTSRIESAIPPEPFSDDPWIGLRTDQLVDGTLWVLVDYDEPSPEIEALVDLWQRHADAAGAL